jgi:diguanylate cyclase (GGDEF)-like protein
LIPPATRFREDVLALLQARSSDALPALLAARLAAALPGARSRVLRVHSASAARIKGTEDSQEFFVTDPARLEPPLAIGSDAALLDAITSRRALSLAAGAGSTRLIAALDALGEIRYLVDLSAEALDSHAEAALRDVIEVAQSYFERLVDAETDPLTRLSNRRVFKSRIDADLRRWIASGRAYYFAMLDIDHFKRVNDDFGHLYGDEILVHFANLMRRTFRAGDLPYRFGGEEFVLIYEAEAVSGGARALERFRAAVQDYDFPGVGTVTVSAGFTRIPDVATPAATLIDRVDRALYYAKEHGRNRICSFDELAAEGVLDARPAHSKDMTLF